MSADALDVHMSKASRCLPGKSRSPPPVAGHPHDAPNKHDALDLYMAKRSGSAPRSDGTPPLSARSDRSTASGSGAAAFTAALAKRGPSPPPGTTTTGCPELDIPYLAVPKQGYGARGFNAPNKPKVCRLPWDTPGTTTIPMFVDHGPSTSACPAEAPSGSTSAPLLASQPRKSSAPAMRDALAAEAGIPAMPAMSSFQRNSSAPPGRGDRSVAGPPVVPGPGGNMMEPVVGAASESVPVAQPAREERQMTEGKKNSLALLKRRIKNQKDANSTMNSTFNSTGSSTMGGTLDAAPKPSLHAQYSPRDAKQSPKFCTACGASLVPMAKFCAECGQGVTPRVALTGPSPPVPAVPINHARPEPQCTSAGPGPAQRSPRDVARQPEAPQFSAPPKPQPVQPAPDPEPPQSAPQYSAYELPENDPEAFQAQGVRVPCSICGRKFDEEKLERHQNICRKTFGKQRKAFDAKDMRTPDEAKQVPKASTPPKAKPKKEGAMPKWKQQHEQLKRAMQAMKGGGSAQEAAPIEIDDGREQCPHCNRKFNPDVAERHIPKCAEMKAKPSMLQRGSGRGAGGGGGTASHLGPSKKRTGSGDAGVRPHGIGASGASIGNGPSARPQLRNNKR